MWVKSQNQKVLVDNYTFAINKVSDGIKVKWEITGKGNVRLGAYDSEMKAMEVMIMIENALLGFGGGWHDIPYDCPMAGTEYHGIFTMPKNEEVKL